MNKREEYIRCRTCGTYKLKEDMYHLYYCSRECSERYEKCKNCGKYFHVRDSVSEEFCSEECETSWHTPKRQFPHVHNDEEGVII